MTIRIGLSAVVCNTDSPQWKAGFIPVLITLPSEGTVIDLDRQEPTAARIAEWTAYGVLGYSISRQWPHLYLPPMSSDGARSAVLELGGDMGYENISRGRTRYHERLTGRCQIVRLCGGAEWSAQLAERFRQGAAIATVKGWL